MIKYLFAILLLNSSLRILSKNLVLNPSFECATDVCDRDDDGRQFHTHVCNWYASNLGTPDVFSTAAGYGCFTQQPNLEDYEQEQPGVQLPHSGKRFAGIFTYGDASQIPLEYREYLYVPLAEPLVVGSYYMASMYVSRASRMVYASNNLGMYFSDVHV